MLVSALTQIEFIATTPHTLIADASPDIIGPDGQTSTISAVVRDVDGNLVKNSVVNFNLYLMYRPDLYHLLRQPPTARG